MDEYNIIDKLFKIREDDILTDVENDMALLKNRVKGIKKEEITKLIADIPQENTDLKEKLIDRIDDLVVDYNIMLAYYNKKYYMQGFEDALEIEIKCK